MEKGLLKGTEKLKKSYIRRKRWHWTVRILAIIIVFCTTYMLILPALTMKSEPPVCGLEEHIHSESCQSMEAQLCQLPEHIHTDDCYPLGEESESPVLCGNGEHTHKDECFDADGELVCSIPEHTHIVDCYVEELDMKADVEDSQQWQEMRDTLTLTENWNEDVLIVAKSQLGYMESEKNVVLEDGKLKGYTRYGAFYNDPYGDWNGMFASFVLHNADINYLPENASLQNWVTTMKKAGKFYEVGSYTPDAGNLVFFGKVQDDKVVANRVAFVAEVSKINKSIKVIEGDVEGKVTYVTYKVDEPAILGYGVLPENKAPIRTKKAATTLAATGASLGTTSATTVNFNALNASSGVQYVLYTQYNGRYYAITSKPGDVVGYAVPVTVSGNTVTWDNADSSMFWNFRRNGNGNSYYVQNFNTGRYIHAFDNSSGSKVDYGTTTAGENPSTLTASANGSFTMQGNRYYNGIYNNNGTITFNRVTNANQAVQFRLAIVGQLYNVWFDGTCGGMMSYYGADDKNLPVSVGSSGTATVTLPETWKSSTKYDYKLQGWYDIKSNVYYAVDPDDGKDVVAQINKDTVFYADWVASTYDVGQDNEHVVDSLDTSNFITTHVFDYNVLFNVLSQSHSGTVSSSSHKESWTIQSGGTRVPYQNSPSLDFAFVDYDADGEFSYAYGRDTINTNQGDKITSNILQTVERETGKELVDILFNPDTSVIGKNYVGEGNYLYQYMDSDTPNYDGVHDGYYYLDARLNAASYNQSLQRFYLYDYLERTSDSQKDGYLNIAGQYSDFLPFNSPYLFREDQLDEYVDRILRPGYEYDAKDGASSYQEYNSVDDATTNYFFGIRSDIEFFLPNDTNTRDEYGNYGNISTRGEHMVFDFHGDDDVWVFIDDELVLDIGGLHGIMYGHIDFSTGEVVVGKDGGDEQVIPFSLSEGTHTMSVYYMERGSSQSNCAIYFNIAPRYDLEITKEDIVSVEKLNGAEFTIYNDEKMTSSAQLWDSEEAHFEDLEDGTINNAKSTFKVVDGVAKCWGISPGKTYYIYETTPPPGYPKSDDIIRITLNNRGTATIETTTLHGENGIATEGFAVIKQDINETLKIVALTVTNQKEGDTTEVRVEKTWDESSVNIPQSITVYLTADGKPVGRQAVLNEGNGWAYTWTGLPKYAEEGVDKEIEYVVEEILVPDYITTQGESVKVDKYVDWIKVDQMSDSKTYLLVHNGQALTYNGRFGWMDPETAKLDSNTTAQWNVSTDHDGFHLKNGAGYTLTFNPNSQSFYGINSDATNLNQVFYYLNSRLVVHDHDVYYQFGTNGTAVSEDGLAFTLYQKEVFTGLLTGITNVPVEEEDQTHVEVTKTWDDGYEMHEDDSIIVSLYADGKDTGRDLTLNSDNNWTGLFTDLPYYQVDGKTKVVYTVVEDPVPGYGAFYSDEMEVEGLPVTIWNEVNSVSAGDKYRFAVGSNVLAMNSNGDVISAPSDIKDNLQQWEVVQRGNNLILRNVGNKRYLVRSGSVLTSTDNQSGATAISVSNNKIALGSYYVDLGTGYVSTTTNVNNATAFDIAIRVDTQGMPGAFYRVSNVSVIPVLPHTGGPAVIIVTIGSLLVLTATVMYIYKFRRKRQKGGH